LIIFIIEYLINRLIATAIMDNKTPGDQTAEYLQYRATQHNTTQHSMSDVRSISSPFLYQVTEASGMAYALHWNTTSSPTVALWSCGRSLINLNVGTAVYTHNSQCTLLNLHANHSRARWFVKAPFKSMGTENFWVRPQKLLGQ